MVILLIAALAIYLVAAYLFVSKRYLRNWVRVKAAEEGNESVVVSGEPVPGSVNDRYRLARVARTILTILHAIVFFLLLLWLPVTLFALIFPQFMPDISFYAWYFVDLAQMPEVSPDLVLFDGLAGTTELTIPAPNTFSYLLFQLTSLVAGVLTVTVLKLLRNIFASYTNGEPFSSGNSRRLETIGKILIAAYVVAPFWYYFLSGTVINLVKIDTDSVNLMMGTNVNVMGIMIGIAILVLSGVIKQAEAANAEQRLTV